MTKEFICLCKINRRRRKILTFLQIYTIINRQKNKHGSSEYEARIRCRAYCFDGMLGDKEITVRIRSNSHYRISCTKRRSSRNAYRSVTYKSLLGKWGDCDRWVGDIYALIRLWYGRISRDLCTGAPRRVLLFYPFAKKTKRKDKSK